jgi:myo-inositol-1(or 4)-monophosphatase
MNEINDKNERTAKSLIAIVNDIMTRYSDTLIRMAVAGNRAELDNKKHKDNFLSEIDLEIHFEYRTRLSQVLPAFIYASEEGDPQICPSGYGDWPEFAVIVDPLDSSELAVRGLHGHTQVLVYSLKEQIPIVSLVGDMFHDIRLFYAFRDQNGSDRAFLMMRSAEELSIKSSQEKNLHEALVTSYSMRPRQRFLNIAEQRAFLDTLARQNEKGQEKGRIGVDFGSIGLCHVAAGFTDAMIEVSKGFTLWDLFPGQYILHAAGGIVTSLAGKELPLNLGLHNLSDVKQAMEKRQKFVAAGNLTLSKAILRHLK